MSTLNDNIDFLNWKTIIRYLIIFAIVLIAGAILKDGVAILITLLILYYSFSRNLYRTLEILLIWFFIYGYFLGQGYITVDFLSKYIVKPSFLLVVVFIIFQNKIPTKILKQRFIVVWLFFLLLTLVSSVIQLQSPFVIISISSFFLMYFLMQGKSLKYVHYSKFLNLFIAVAILQTIVSFLQVSGILPPPSKLMSDGSGGQFEWIAGLDDAASGTFGPDASHLTSWYASLISLLLILTWAVTKKNIYLLLMIFTFLQFATVDSKTILAISILMLSYLVLFLIQKRTAFQINIGRYLFIAFFISTGIFGFSKAWSMYYKFTEQSEDRVDLNDVYENEVTDTRNIILNNISNWGKIKGFQYVFEDFIENDPTQLIWGYGIQGYSADGKMSYIESKDNSFMASNNLTNSRSGLIKQFAISGLLGFILLVIAVIQWYNYSKQRAKGKSGLIKSSLLRIYLPFTILASFLYSVDITSIPVIVFATIISIYENMAQLNTNKT